MANNNLPQAYYFYSNNCKDCKHTSEVVLPYIIDKYYSKIEIVKYDIGEHDALFLKIAQILKYRKISSPAVYFMGKIFVGKEIENQLDKYIGFYFEHDDSLSTINSGVMSKLKNIPILKPNNTIYLTFCYNSKEDERHINDLINSINSFYINACIKKLKFTNKDECLDAIILPQKAGVLKKDIIEKKCSDYWI